MAWPDRTWFCLDCRMALTAQACPAGHDRVVELADTEALVAEAWGPPRMRQQLLEAGKAGTGGGAAWSLLEGCGNAIDMDLGVFLAVVGVVAAVWFVACAAARFIRARTRRQLARGATRKLAKIARTGQTGTILPRATEGLPGLGDGVAFAAEYDFGGRRMLHDAATVGFEVLLDSGERVVVPPGSCLIALDAAGEVSLEPLVVRIRGTFDPFVHGRVRGLVLSPGDRVEVCSPLEAVPDASAGYRDVGLVRAPRGIIRLRPC